MIAIGVPNKYLLKFSECSVLHPHMNISLVYEVVNMHWWNVAKIKAFFSAYEVWAKSNFIVQRPINHNPRTSTSQIFLSSRITQITRLNSKKAAYILYKVRTS